MMSPEIEISTTILSALLTGGFILFFVENQHIESEVINRYHAIMDIYYHKLSHYLKFVYFIESRLRYEDLNNEYCKDYKEIIDYLSKKGSEIFTTGKNIAYQKAEQLDSLNKKINDVWFYNDKFSSLRNTIFMEHIQIFPDIQVFEVLSEISAKYPYQSINKSILPKVSGEFFCNIWEPVNDVTWRFEFWQKKCASFKKLLTSSIIIVMLVLVFSMISSNSLCPAFFIFLTILSCLAFVIILFRINKLLTLSHRIFK